jgi:hypothetical protein
MGLPRSTHVTTGTHARGPGLPAGPVWFQVFNCAHFSSNPPPTLIWAHIQVYVQDAAENADRYCWLMLYDSQGRVSDKSKVPAAFHGGMPSAPNPALVERRASCFRATAARAVAPSPSRPRLVFTTRGYTSACVASTLHTRMLIPHPTTSGTFLHQRHAVGRDPHRRLQRQQRRRRASPDAVRVRSGLWHNPQRQVHVAQQVLGQDRGLLRPHRRPACRRCVRRAA